MIIPYRTASLYNRTPWANWAIFGITILVSVYVFGSLNTEEEIPMWLDSMVLSDWNPAGLFGHTLLHADFMHLAGNMLYLWVFGNAVCAKVGNLRYPLIYALCALGAAWAHLTFSDMPCIGASGAINGILGVYLVLQPVNDVHMAYWFWMRGGTFAISGFWAIGAWFAFDIFGAFFSSTADPTAYWAHIGGFLTGLLAGFILVLLRQVKMDEYDNPTLPEYFKIVPRGHCGGYERVKPESAPKPAMPRIPGFAPPVAPPITAPPMQPRQSIPFRPRGQVTPAPVILEAPATTPCPQCQATLTIPDPLPPGQTIQCPTCHATLETG